MSSQAKIVLWIGVVLIIVQLAKQWKTIRGFLFTPGPGSVPTGGAAGSSTLCLLNPALCAITGVSAGGMQMQTPNHTKAPVI